MATVKSGGQNSFRDDSRFTTATWASFSEFGFCPTGAEVCHVVDEESMSEDVALRRQRDPQGLVRVVHRAWQLYLTCGALILCWAFLSTRIAFAHPIEYHMQPLEAAAVERVLISLEQMVTAVEASDMAGSLRLPDDAMGISVLLWTLQDALMNADEVTTLDSPTLHLALQSAGYPISDFIVETWQIEAERVIGTYEVLSRNLDLSQVQVRYAALDDDRAALSPERAMEFEAALLRDHELVKTTGKDLDLIEHYRPRLDALFERMGVIPRRGQKD